MREQKVAVVGGGLSGLTCAYYLGKTNIDVTLFERSGRLGGRIYAACIEGRPIDLGAQFYTSGGNVEKMIDDLGLSRKVRSIGKNWLSCVKDGGIYTLMNKKDLQKLLGRKGVRELKELKKAFERFKMFDELRYISFRDWYIDNIGEELLWFWDRTLKMVGISHMGAISAISGPIANILLTEQKTLEGGMGILVDALRKDALSSGVNINLKHSCKTIEEDRNGYRIGFSDGYSQAYDKIVFALPPEEVGKLGGIRGLKSLDNIRAFSGDLWVIKSKKNKIGCKTWGLSVLDESSIYGCFLWNNLPHIDPDAPIGVWASKEVGNIKDEFNRILGIKSKNLAHLHWSSAFHQADVRFFEIRDRVISSLPEDIYLIGDWMDFPGVEGAVSTGKNIVNKL